VFQNVWKFAFPEVIRIRVPSVLSCLHFADMRAVVFFKGYRFTHFSAARLSTLPQTLFTDDSGYLLTY
jgi:hypothetical protein